MGRHSLFNRSPPRWWENFMEETFAVLREKPCKATVQASAEKTVQIVEAQKCKICSSHITEGMLSGSLGTAARTSRWTLNRQARRERNRRNYSLYDDKAGRGNKYVHGPQGLSHSLTHARLCRFVCEENRGDSFSDKSYPLEILHRADNFLDRSSWS